MVPSNSLECSSFSRSAFVSLVRQASNHQPGDPTNTQTDYLASHLEALGAVSLVVERHYVDRHFMEEVGLGAGDYFGLLWDRKAIGGAVDYLGLVIRYTRSS